MNHDAQTVSPAVVDAYRRDTALFSGKVVTNGTTTWTPTDTVAIPTASHTLTWPEAFEHVGLGVCIAVGIVCAIGALGKAFS